MMGEAKSEERQKLRRQRNQSAPVTDRVSNSYPLTSGTFSQFSLLHPKTSARSAPPSGWRCPPHLAQASASNRPSSSSPAGFRVCHADATRRDRQVRLWWFGQIPSCQALHAQWRTRLQPCVCNARATGSCNLQRFQRPLPGQPPPKGGQGNHARRKNACEPCMVEM